MTGHNFVTKVMTGHDVWGDPPEDPCGALLFRRQSRFFFLDFKIPIGKGTFTIGGGKMIRKIVYLNIDFENGNCVMKKWFITWVNNLFTRSFYLIRVSLVSISECRLYSVRMYSIRDTFIRSIESILTSSRDRLVCKSVTIKLAQDSVLSQNDSVFMVPILVKVIRGKYPNWDIRGKCPI